MSAAHFPARLADAWEVLVVHQRQCDFFVIYLFFL